MSKSAPLCALWLGGGSGGIPPEKSLDSRSSEMGSIVQSESVELRILLSWSDELTIYTLLPLHRAFHIAHTWPNSKYEEINEILYHPSIVRGGGIE